MQLPPANFTAADAVEIAKAAQTKGAAKDAKALYEEMKGINQIPFK
ncbi:hypothetical protein [Amylibacter sp. SFDW26]|nr:hypothetical protein [Amylibacter sp. SFDW26]